MRRLDEAVVMFAEVVDIFRERDICAELRSRTLLCVAEAERGRADAAREQLDRCDEILSQGEDWLGQIGRVEMARGAVLTCGGQFHAANATFGRAIDVLRRYELVWDEAETFRLWGRMLAAAGDGDGAMAKFEQAIGIYSRIGAGTPWITRIVREFAGVPADGGERTWAG
jgi:tetratricopeptide (TPR) repeat protein